MSIHSGRGRIMYITLVSRALLIGRSVVHNPSVITTCVLQASERRRASERDRTSGGRADLREGESLRADAAVFGERAFGLADPSICEPRSSQVKSSRVEPSRVESCESRVESVESSPIESSRDG